MYPWQLSKNIKHKRILTSMPVTKIVEKHPWHWWRCPFSSWMSPFCCALDTPTGEFSGHVYLSYGQDFFIRFSLRYVASVDIIPFSNWQRPKDRDSHIKLRNQILQSYLTYPKRENNVQVQKRVIQSRKSKRPERMWEVISRICSLNCMYFSILLVHFHHFYFCHRPSATLRTTLYDILLSKF